MKTPVNPKLIFKRAVIIAAAAVLVLTLAAAMVAYLIASGDAIQQGEPLYSTSSLILVQSAVTLDSPVNSSLNGEKIRTEDIESSIMLANTCATLFTVDPDMKALIGGADISITAVEDSYFLRITATSGDPYTAANVANLVATAAPSVFKKYYGDAGRVAVVEEATVPSAPSGAAVAEERIGELPHIVAIAALSALSVGLIAAFILIAAIISSREKKYRTYLQSQASSCYPAE